MRDIAATSARLLSVAWLMLLLPSAPLLAQGVVEEPGVRDSNVGYIDPAPLMNSLRLRFDAAYDSNRPSRAEFFYPRSGFPVNPGPPLSERSIDYQETGVRLEGLLLPRLSGFVEVPVRFFNGGFNPNSAGLSDISAGLKFGLWSDCDSILTFQFRTYVPSGDSDRGLGTNHVSLEPGLLFFRRLTAEGLSLEGEFRTWVPVGGTDFAGTILRYGLGVSRRWRVSDRFGVAPVAEFVGWTVLDGKAGAAQSPTFFTIEDAAGDTIVNAKLGIRLGLRDVGSLYAGYGRPLTGEVWYEDTWRLELRFQY